MEKALLEVRDLSVTYRVGAELVAAANRVSFQVKQGEVFVVVGESGCGKSSIAYAIPRLLKGGNETVTGQVNFEGRNLLGLTEQEMEDVRGEEIGMIFQNPLNSLNPVYTIGDQIAEPFVQFNMSKTEAKEISLAAIRTVHIPESEKRFHSYPHEMSGGQLQRVVIAMASSRRPKLLIADEPTTALDVTIESRILEMIKELKTEEGNATSVLLITHNFGTVAEIADTVAVMYGGFIVEQAGVFQLFDHAAHPYTQMLMEALPKIKKSEGRLATIPGVVPRLTPDFVGCCFASRCPRAFEACTTETPRMTDLGNGHMCACHLLEKGENP